MPDETTQETAQTAGEAGSTTQAESTGHTTGTTTDSVGTVDEKRFTQADLDRLLKARLAEEKERQKRAQETADAEKRGEWEKVATKERQQREAAEAKLRSKALLAELATLAPEHGLASVRLALPLISAGVEWDEDGEPTNVAALLKQLAKDEPILFPPKKTEAEEKPPAGLAPKGGRQPGGTSRTGEPTDEDRQRHLRTAARTF